MGSSMHRAALRAFLTQPSIQPHPQPLLSVHGPGTAPWLSTGGAAGTGAPLECSSLSRGSLGGEGTLLRGNHPRAVPCLLQHTAPASAVSPSLLSPPPWGRVSPGTDRLQGALRAELLTQLLSFLCWYPHVYVPALLEVMFRTRG